jgi:hypothetical protein
MIISFSFYDLDDNTNLVLTCVKYVLHKLCKKRSGVKTSEEAEQKKSKFLENTRTGWSCEKKNTSAE